MMSTTLYYLHEFYYMITSLRDTDSTYTLILPLQTLYTLYPYTVLTSTCTLSIYRLYDHTYSVLIIIQYLSSSTLVDILIIQIHLHSSVLYRIIHTHILSYIRLLDYHLFSRLHSFMSLYSYVLKYTCIIIYIYTHLIDSYSTIVYIYYYTIYTVLTVLLAYSILHTPSFLLCHSYTTLGI